MANKRKQFPIILLAFLLLGSAFFLWFAIDHYRPNFKLGSRMQDLQFSGSAGRAREVVGADEEAFLESFDEDALLIVAYGVFFYLGGFLGTQIFQSANAKGLAQAGASAGVVAAVADAIENLALLRGLNHLSTSTDRPFAVAASAATVKFSLAAFSLVVALVAALAVSKRAIAHISDTCPQIKQLRESIILPWPTVGSSGDPWPRYASGIAGDFRGLGFRGRERHRYGGLVPSTDGDCRGTLDRSPWWQIAAALLLLLKARKKDADTQESRVTAGESNSPKVVADPSQIQVDVQESDYQSTGNRTAWPSSREPALIGFCVSGGGIRSASFVMGALQSLREELRKARYLVSVSGGGYTVGAMQLALRPPRLESDGENPATAKDVYQEGSMEEDYTRRHGAYLSDGVGQFSAALWHVLRGIIFSILVIVSTVATLGLLVSYFYSAVPVVKLGGLRDLASETDVNKSSESSFEVKSSAGDGVRTAEESVAVMRKDTSSAGQSSTDFPLAKSYVGWTLGGLIALASACWIFSQARLGANGDTARLRAQRMANASLGAAALVALAAYLIPAFMWLAALVLRGADIESEGAAAGAAAGATIFVTYAGAITAIAGGHKKAKKWFKNFGSFGKDEAKTSPIELSKGLMPTILTWLILTLFLGINLLVLGTTALFAVEWNGWAAAFPLTLGIIWLTVDQTWMSLHPFYRGRLATAFAVRRVKLRSGDVGAQPYDFERERTCLSKYGERAKEFPQVIFACAANLSGSDRTPMGRRAVSFTMSGDFIGGADVGWIPTALLEDVVHGAMRVDLTLQAAMAVSGAAFASAMGTGSKGFESLLALSNARLGTWLPNPVYLHRLASEGAPWWMPRLPRIRRITYFFREVFGSLPKDNRLLLITDGGHYDNLGLIELLRHRCRTIYCVDSSGDNSLIPETLTRTMSQARVELGVRIDFRRGELAKLLPGMVPDAAAAARIIPDGPLDPAPVDQAAKEDDEVPEPLKPIMSRLSANAVAVADITYPDEFSADDECSNKGYLIFAKALLTPDMPPELFATAVEREIFPRDSTGDQWFTYDRFNSYQALGRHVGAAMSKRAEFEGLAPHQPTT